MVKMKMVCPLCCWREMPAGSSGDVDCPVGRYPYELTKVIGNKPYNRSTDGGGFSQRVLVEGPSRLWFTVPGHAELPIPHYTDGSPVKLRALIEAPAKDTSN